MEGGAHPAGALSVRNFFEDVDTSLLLLLRRPLDAFGDAFGQDGAFGVEDPWRCC